jgi:hypothetical protein
MGNYPPTKCIHLRANTLPVCFYEQSSFAIKTATGFSRVDTETSKRLIIDLFTGMGGYLFDAEQKSPFGD